MRYPKPWQIGKVNIDPPSDLPFEPRLSIIEILDSDNQLVCSIRTYSQTIVRDIITCVNEYDKSMKLQECADCLYYTKDILTGEDQCKYPKGCVNKNLFERKEDIL